ncbi:MAG: protein kinase, partial [Bacteroidetes bacterium]|nr:protein kinase [Bacteroidota bacterium]
GDRLLDGDLPLLAKLDIAAQIARGLAYAHDRGVIHRDIKPDNIQVLDNGRVKILDFGIARIGAETGTLTRTNTSLGTPRYMSPEQIRGETVDHRADIFSFGVVLYEMLTGLPPFDGDHITAIIYKVLNTEPEPLHLEPGRLSDSLQTIVAGCLTKDPDARYGSLHEVLDDLRSVRLRHDQTLASTVDDRTWALSPSADTSATRRVTGAPSSRSPSRALFVGLGLLLVLGLLGGGYWLLQNDSAPPTAEPEVTTSPPSPTTDRESQIGNSVADAADDTSNATAAAPPATSAATAPPETTDPATTPDAESDAAARRTATTARTAMTSARERAADRRDAAGAAGLWDRAEAQRRAGQQALDAGDLDAAAQAFRTAEALYQEIGRLAQAAEPTTAPAPTDPAASTPEPDPNAADAARDAMASARERVPDALTGTAAYQDAESLAERAETAYDDEQYDDAASLYQEAREQYQAAAAQPNPAVQARQTVQALAARLQRGFEAEDLDLLGSLSPFYASWDDFFQVADDIAADVQPGPVRLDGAQATVQVDVRLSYADNKNRRQESSFVHQWTLHSEDNQWTLTEVATR